MLYTNYYTIQTVKKQYSGMKSIPDFSQDIVYDVRMSADKLVERDDQGHGDDAENDRHDIKRACLDAVAAKYVRHL